MEVILAKNAGFCPGVKRAVDKALSYSNTKNTYTLGELIHNPIFTKRLSDMGIRAVTFEDIPALHAHILRGVKQMALENGIDENTYLSLLTDNVKNFIK